MHEGFIEEGKLFCPVHGWQFDLKTENLVPNRKGLDSYDVKIVDGNVYAKVLKKKLRW